MSTGPLKEKQKNSTKLFEACGRCGKPRDSNLGGTITRWFFPSMTCECTANEALNSCANPLVAPTEQGTAKGSGSNVVDQARQTLVYLGDRYQILETIGQGGMGTVYRLRDTVLDKEFAVKVLRDEFAADSSAIKRFEQEADAASQLTHFNILATYGRGTTPSGAPYILMDLVEGESLAQLLKREITLDVSRVIDISTQICDALAHAHMKGLIHRDLKPSNVMLTNRNGVSATVKVLDFGISKLQATSNRETQNLTETGELFGSPSYMSPEQCLGCAVDARSDIYSLGCIMYEMLCGRPPFRGENPIQTVVQHLNDEPPPLTKLLPANPTTTRLQAIVMRCLEKTSDQRYQSMDVLKADLQLVAEGKLPKQVSKPALKAIPLSWAVVLTIVTIGVNLVVQEIETIGLISDPVIWERFSQAHYVLQFICIYLWIVVLGQACWKNISKVATRQTELHEKWMAATLVFLTIYSVPAAVSFYTSTYLSTYFAPISGEREDVLFRVASAIGGPAYLLSNISIFLAFICAVAWALAWIVHASKLSRVKQRLVAFLCVGSLALFAILGHKNLALLPYGASRYLNSDSTNGYRPNPGLELALAIDPDLAEAYDSRGCEKLIAGEPSCGADFSKAIQLRPDDAFFYMHRAKADELSGQFAKAASDLQRCLELAPTINGSGLRLQVAYYLGRSKQYEKALAIYDNVIAHPGGILLTQAHALRSDIHLRLGNLKQALADVNTALADFPDDATFHILRAQIHEKNGKSTLATEEYKAVLKNRQLGKTENADVDKAGTYRSYAIAAQRLGLLDQSKKDFAQAAEYKAPRETNGFNEIDDTWLISDAPMP